jgi:hypothetical protein
MLVLLQVDDVSVPLTVLYLHVVLALVMMTQILSCIIIIIFMEFMLVILNLLTTSNDLVLLSGPSKPGILKDHFLAVDVLYRLGFLPVQLGHLVHLLLFHEVLNQLLGEWELARVLVILLLEVLEQHLAVLVIKLVEVDHHFFVLFTLLAFVFLFVLLLIVILLLLLASLLSCLVARAFGLLLKLELLKLLGDVNIQFFFLLVLIIFLVVMIFHHLGLLLLKEASCATFLLLLHHLLLELNALEDGRGIGLAWQLGPFFLIVFIITEWLWVAI